jgi:hypothetical protein
MIEKSGEWGGNKKIINQGTKIEKEQSKGHSKNNRAARG